MLRQNLLRAGIAALLIFLLQAYAFELFVIPSRSMAPTLRRGDVVLVDRLTYEFNGPRRGDLMVFHFPQADDQSFLKRVIGLPGDTVMEHDDEVWVNGSPVPRSTMHVRPPGEAAQSLPPVRVPAGHYFVLGDNPSTSLDSRVWGTVAFHQLVGKALIILWSQGAHWWDVRWRRIGHRLQ